ncbi:hypothetical protein OBBRIDRAFT_501868 [Obba rivulosa]|uniref:F-box domain-containing protein n=1 Tax=Obba rivulosa TaxID=1052685 RepID=A0A8E2J6L9_9APHY|nr:hypothetical protein OBBRIDRAFT_501868 [Obba rivulosa]
MHRALLIDEILAAIFVHVGFVTPRIHNQAKSLARAARCCSAFKDPALNELWKYQTSLLPLFRVLSSLEQRDGIYVRTYLRSSSQQQLRRTKRMLQTLSGPISANDLDRCRQYAKRIRTLVYTRQTHIHPCVFISLAQMSCGIPLLPSLQILHWRQAVDDDPVIDLLPSPSITNVDIQLYQTDWGLFGGRVNDDPSTECSGHAIQTLLTALVAQNSPLESLRLAGRVPEPVLDIIEKFPRLQHLDLGMTGRLLDNEAFNAIASFRHLKLLNMHADGVSGSRNLAISFPSLETLEISGSPQSTCAVIDSVQSDALDSVYLSSSGYYSAVEARSLMQTFRSRLGSSLRRLHMRLLLRDHGPAVMDFLDPLLALPQLNDLHFHIEGKLVVRDVDVGVMASTWSMLRNFHLSYSRVTDDCRLTLGALLSFATKCPTLRSISLPLDAQTPFTLPAGHSPSHPLRSLCLLGDVRVDDAQAVTKALRSLFPKLRHFNAFAWDTKQNLLWGRIKHAILWHENYGTSSR